MPEEIPTLLKREEMPGELWIKNTEGLVQPATTALVDLYNQFSVEYPTVYNDLTNGRILKIDNLFDTLMIQTSGALILSKVLYDKASDKTFFTADNTKIKGLTNNEFRLEDTWFLPEEKKLICAFTRINEVSFFPELYTFDLNTTDFLKAFPSSNENTFSNTLSAFSPPLKASMSYNSLHKMFVLTYTALDADENPVFINFKIFGSRVYEFKELDIYKNENLNFSQSYPPLMPKEYLKVFNIPINTFTQKTVIAQNQPELYYLKNQFPSVTLSPGGTFSIVLTGVGLYHINYCISNKIGTTCYALSLSGY